jgi:exodeoxyribonuclease V gamma subunit
MAYELITGQRLETLVGGHLDLFRSGFFGPRPLVVLQNQSLAQWLKLFFARTAGGFATGDFVFQDEALRRLAEGASPTPVRMLFLDDLKLELYRHLASADRDPVFAPLVGGGAPDPLRLFELADHIAGVFHNYAMNSRLWPTALASGQQPPGSPADAATFAWQSRLWRDLAAGGGGTLAGLALEALTRSVPAPSGPPTRVVLVGSAFLSRRAADFLRAWAVAGRVEVVHLLLLPAPPGVWPDTRPWSSWGAFGRAFLDALPSVAAVLPEPPADATALSALQRALAAGEAFPCAEPDGTLEVVSAPHPLRELEVLRDRLLAALAADPTLELNEIAVLAPDINVYAPFLDAAFASDDPGRHLRHHVIDLDLGRENAWFRALDALLALASGTIDRPSLFALVDAPAFQEAWDVGEDRELWLDYTEEVWAWRETPEGGVQTWSAGAERLFAGWFRSDALDDCEPLDTAPSSFRSLGRFHQLLDALRELGHETARPRPFAEWIRFFDQTVGTFLAPGDGTGAVLAGRLRTLVADSASPDEPLPWAGFRAFVQDQIAHFPGRRGQLLTEGIHCSSLRPLRAIPFRIVAVLGLDEGRFPRQAPVPSFDLSRFEPEQERSSALALDRYCFWETVMAARSVLYLSYQGRSAVDGSERPPSPVLADLLDYLEEGGRAWPVGQASVKDFSVGPDAPATWSPRTRRRAEALAAARPGADTPTPEVADQELDELFPEVRSSEVAEAFTVPAKFHLRRVRQMTLRDEDRRGIDEEEPWSLAFLDREAWLQEQLRRHLAGQAGAWDLESFLRCAQSNGQVRPGVFADRDRRDLELRTQQVAAWAQELVAEGWTVRSTPVPRALWAGRPWAPEPDGRLVKSGQVLLPRPLYSESLPARTKVEAALGLLQDPAPAAVLDTLSPRAVRTTLTWTPDEAATRALVDRAEAYWREAARRPLPFYPDYLEAVAARRKDHGEESWPATVEEAWQAAWSSGGPVVRSRALLSRDPYAALAFREDPDWTRLAADLEPWWDGLFAPLLEAWQ